MTLRSSERRSRQEEHMIKTRNESSQSVWVISTPEVELCLTKTGGMMAPVTFRRFGAGGERSVRPYYISPWQDEGLDLDVAVLRPLRGDFFCAPFGANGEFEGSDVQPHGASACESWDDPEIEQTDDVVTLRTQIASTHPRGTITKTITLRTGEHAVYTTHTLADFQTPLPVGHHACLDSSDDAPLLLARSPYRFGRVATSNSPVYADEEYRSLPGGAEFESLTSVPTRFTDDPVTDCTIFPARRGFVDILATFDEIPATGESSNGDTTLSGRGYPAWTTAARPGAGYLWYSLKDPGVLPSAVMWMENHGRHAPPWNGRNRCIGLEDVCAYYADGLVPSISPNELNDAGVPTALESPASVHYVQGLVPIPSDFGHVTAVHFADIGAEFADAHGHSVTTPVDWRYVFER